MAWWEFGENQPKLCHQPPLLLEQVLLVVAGSGSAQKRVCFEIKLNYHLLLSNNKFFQGQNSRCNLEHQELYYLLLNFVQNIGKTKIQDTR